MDVFEDKESKVRSYCHSFPTVFKKSNGSYLYDEDGKKYIDFFAGAGTLNYGHNNPALKKVIIDYLQNDGIVHGLDMATSAKRDYLERFYEVILKPRNLEYKFQFTGPTGTNAVETSLKLARMVKGRSNVISFTNGYHGLTMGSMAVTANAFYRDEAFINRSDVSFMPYDGYLGKDVDTTKYIRRFLDDGSSGVDLPSAIILETVQAEGGINVASAQWLKEIEKICHEYDILLIIDDIQVGNGRTGSFFSFERAGIYPDIITLSKSIGGYGLPMSIVLLKPELDQWKPGEHTGTFRGNNLAFVAATESLKYWEDDNLSNEILEKSKIIEDRLIAMQKKFPELHPKVRGLGMIMGIEFTPAEIASFVASEAFEKGLIIELAGSKNQVLKFLPPLTIDKKDLKNGLDIIEESVEKVIASQNRTIIAS